MLSMFRDHFPFLPNLDDCSFSKGLEFHVNVEKWWNFLKNIFKIHTRQYKEINTPQARVQLSGVWLPWKYEESLGLIPSREEGKESRERGEKRRKDKRLSSLDQKLLLNGPLLPLYQKHYRVRTHRWKTWAAALHTPEGHFCFTAPGSLPDFWCDCSRLAVFAH